MGDHQTKKKSQTSWARLAFPKRSSLERTHLAGASAAGASAGLAASSAGLASSVLGASAGFVSAAAAPSGAAASGVAPPPQAATRTATGTRANSLEIDIVVNPPADPPKAVGSERVTRRASTKKRLMRKPKIAP